MQIHRDIPASLHACNAPDMIEVRVREPNRLGRRATLFDAGDNAIGFRARIYDGTAIRVRIDEEIAVLLKRPDREAGNRQAHCVSRSRVRRTGASAVSSTGDSPSPWWASQRSASSAAMQPVPAAVIA